MKKYLGSKITAMAALIAPIFVCGSLLFAFIVVYSEINGESIFLAIACVACAFVWGLYIKSISNQLYSWGYFGKESVQVKIGFSKSSTLIYEKCQACGIGFYTHGILNSNAGTKIYFIFLSYDMFDESLRSNINLLKPSSTCIKVEFSQKLYNYLITVLPPKQAQMLCRDYKEYIE